MNRLRSGELAGSDTKGYYGPGLLTYKAICDLAIVKSGSFSAGLKWSPSLRDPFGCSATTTSHFAHTTSITKHGASRLAWRNNLAFERGATLGSPRDATLTFRSQISLSDFWWLAAALGTELICLHPGHCVTITL